MFVEKLREEMYNIISKEVRIKFCIIISEHYRSLMTMYVQVVKSYDCSV